jgi:hypothetical protein
MSIVGKNGSAVDITVESQPGYEGAKEGRAVWARWVGKYTRGECGARGTHVWFRSPHATYLSNESKEGYDQLVDRMESVSTIHIGDTNTILASSLPLILLELGLDVSWTPQTAFEQAFYRMEVANHLEVLSDAEAIDIVLEDICAYDIAGLDGSEKKRAMAPILRFKKQISRFRCVFRSELGSNSAAFILHDKDATVDELRAVYEAMMSLGVTWVWI